MAAFTELSPTRLMRLIGTPECPAIVDVCLDDDLALDPVLVPTAQRRDFRDPGAIAEALAGRRAVVICQKGKKLSHGVAAWLRQAGIAAEVLEGGMTGWRAAPGTISVPFAAIPAHRGGATLWVTRHRPKIDRIACPWLIRRFVDPGARFLFVPSSEVEAVAERFGGTPFDIEGAFWSHRGAGCSFDAMVTEFGLSHPALDRLAAVVRAADTNRHEDAPEAAGLLALSVGLSRQYKDDTAQMEAGMAMYDALYRWARDGADEGHDWPRDRA